MYLNKGYMYSTLLSTVLIQIKHFQMCRKIQADHEVKLNHVRQLEREKLETMKVHLYFLLFVCSSYFLHAVL